MTGGVRGRGYWFVPMVFGLATLGSVGFYQERSPCPAGQSSCSYRLDQFATALLHAGLTPMSSGSHQGAGIYWLAVVPATFALVVVFYVLRGGSRPVGRLVSAVGMGPVLLAALVMLGYDEPGTGSLLPADFVVRGLVGVVVLGLTMLVLGLVEHDKTVVVLAAGAVGAAFLACLYDIENVTGNIANSPTAPNVIVPGLYFLLAALVLGLPDLVGWVRRSSRRKEAPRPAPGGP